MSQWTSTFILMGLYQLDRKFECLLVCLVVFHTVLFKHAAVCVAFNCPLLLKLFVFSSTNEKDNYFRYVARR